MFLDGRTTAIKKIRLSRLVISLAIVLVNITAVRVKAEIAQVNPQPISAQVGTTENPKTPAEGNKLRVGIVGYPPTVIQSTPEQISGISVVYWQELAETLGLTYELVPYSNIEESLAAVADGKVDLALGSISITAERIDRFDFTYPVFQTDLTLLLPSSPPSLWDRVRPFLGWAFLSSVGAIFLCLCIVGTLIWMAEREQNSEQFPKAYFPGLREGIWCALATFSTVGYGDRFPITHLGRSVAAVWMILSLVMVTSLTAGIATTLAVAFAHQPSTRFNSPEDLRNARIASVGKDSAPTRWAQFYQARVSITPKTTDAISLLDNGKVDGVIDARTSLEYYLQQHPQVSYEIASFNIANEYIAIALPLDSPLTQTLNKQILQVGMQFRLQEMTDNWQQLTHDLQPKKPQSKKPQPKKP